MTTKFWHPPRFVYDCFSSSDALSRVGGGGMGANESSASSQNVICQTILFALYSGREWHAVYKHGILLLLNCFWCTTKALQAVALFWTRVRDPACHVIGNQQSNLPLEVLSSSEAVLRSKGITFAMILIITVPRSNCSDDLTNSLAFCSCKSRRDSWSP